MGTGTKGFPVLTYSLPLFATGCPTFLPLLSFWCIRSIHSFRSWGTIHWSSSDTYRPGRTPCSVIVLSDRSDPEDQSFQFFYPCSDEDCEATHIAYYQFLLTVRCLRPFHRPDISVLPFTHLIDGVPQTFLVRIMLTATTSIIHIKTMSTFWSVHVNLRLPKEESDGSLSTSHTDFYALLSLF